MGVGGMGKQWSESQMDYLVSRDLQKSLATPSLENSGLVVDGL